MKRLVKLQAPKKNENDYPDIDANLFLEYLMNKTHSENISELSTKIPFSQAYLNSISNNFNPLTQSFVNRVQNELDFTLDDYKSWLTGRDKEDSGRKTVKKRKRPGFDQSGFLKFIVDIAKRRVGLSKSEVQNMVGISPTLWNSIENEKAELSDSTLKKIETTFGLGKNEFNYYLADPKNMIDYITSRELETMSQKYHKGTVINKSTKFSKFLEAVTGLTSEQLKEELGINPEQAVKKENGKIAIPKNLVQSVQKNLGLSFDQFRDYSNNPNNIERFMNDKIQKLQFKYTKENNNSKSRSELKNIDTTQFIDFLLAATNLKQSQLSRTLDYKSNQLTSMKTNNSKITNEFLERVNDKLGLTIDDFYAYQQDPSSLKTVNIAPPKEENSTSFKERVDKRKAPSYIEPTSYVKMLVDATGLNMGELSGQLGLSHSYISNVKNSKIPVYVELLKNIEATFQITVQDYYLYTQNGTIPDKGFNSAEEEEETNEHVFDASLNNSFLNFLCLREETNLLGLASMLNLADQDILNIKNQQTIITSEFITAINNLLNADIMTEFEDFQSNGLFSLNITDYRQQAAPTKEE